MSKVLVADTNYHVCPDTFGIPWIESPFFDKLLATANLTTEEKALVQFFAENGYVIIDPEIPFELIERVRADLEGNYTQSATGYEEASRIQDAWKFSEAVKQIATQPKVLKILELLYQRKPIPFQTLNFEKGTEQKTHSDTIHFQSVPANFMCGVWVALEDIDAENGPLHYYPKSHKLPLYDMNHLGLPANGEYYKDYENFVEAMFALGNFEKHEISVKKGQALVWAANLFHGGNEILNPKRTRYSQVTHYYFDGCMYFTPLISEPFRNRIYFRTSELRDVRTGKVIPHYYRGVRVEPYQSDTASFPKSILKKLPPIFTDTLKYIQRNFS